GVTNTTKKIEQCSPPLLPISRSGPVSTSRRAFFLRSLHLFSLGRTATPCLSERGYYHLNALATHAGPHLEGHHVPVPQSPDPDQRPCCGWVRFRTGNARRPGAPKRRGYRLCRRRGI